MNAELKELQGPGLADYANVLKRRIWYVIVPFVLCSLAAVGVAFLVPKEYKAVTEVIVDDPDAMVGSAYTPVGITVPHKHLLNTFAQDVKTGDFLMPLIDQFGITEGYNPSNLAEKKKLLERVRKKLDVVATLQKVGPDLVTFSYIGRDPVRVNDFTNAVRRKWQEEFMRRYGGAIGAIQKNIDEIFFETNKKYQAATAALRSFQETNGSDYFGKDAGANGRARLEKLEAELEENELRLQAERATLQTQAAQLKRIDRLTTSETSRKRNPDWVKQSAFVEAAQSVVRDFEQKKYLDTWPKMAEAKARVADEQAKLEKIDEFITDSVVLGSSQPWIKLTNDQTETQSEIAKLEQRIEKTRKLIEELRPKVDDIPEKAARAQALRDAVDVTYLQFERASRAREVAKNTRERMNTKNTSFFRVTLETLPEDARFADPVYPNYALFAGIGAFLGLLIGGGIAFIGEFSAAAFTTPSQVRYMLQVPILGEVAPLVTRYDVQRRNRKRGIFIAIAGLILVVILVIHLMWFDADWRAELPPLVRDVMRKVYGAR